MLVVIDDVGIDQLACYDDQNHYVSAYPYAYTPNIQRLVNEGARFTQCRGAPLCSPARAMLMTGRYSFRTGCGALVQPQTSTSEFLELGVPHPEIGLPSILPGRREAIGKWHLALDPMEGGTIPEHPLDLGFQSWQGTLRNIGTDPIATPGGASYTNFWWWFGGTRSLHTGTHATVYTALQAYAFRHRVREPAFLYLAFNACHDPLTLADVPPVDEHGFGTIPSEFYANTILRANLECLDTQLGQLLAHTGPNTFIVLVGDNGTAMNVMAPVDLEPRYPVGHPLHQPGDEVASFTLDPYEPARAKGNVYEAGIRIPLIVWGPGVVPGTRDDLVDMVDLFATVADLFGAQVPAGAAQDSISLLPILAGAAGSRTFSFSERFQPNGIGPIPKTMLRRAFIRREGTQLWKLIRKQGSTDEFYELTSDPLEANDLGIDDPAYPATLAEMNALLSS